MPAGFSLNLNFKFWGLLAFCIYESQPTTTTHMETVDIGGDSTSIDLLLSPIKSVQSVQYIYSASASPGSRKKKSHIALPR